MEPAFIISAFLAGFLTFLAPCTLPLVPIYLGFISGVDPKAFANKTAIKETRRKVLINGVAFVLGFTLIFILFGVLVGIVGQALVPYRLWLSRLGGLLIIAFGLYMLGIFKWQALSQTKKFSLEKYLHPGQPSSAFIVGATFALAWTPCVGPILGSILLLASTQTTVVQGALLLFIFSLGLAIPFLLVAVLFARALEYIKVLTKYTEFISLVAGVLLVLLGFLLLTNNFGWLTSSFFQWFSWLNYEGILNYL
jgi:cytochrome c-type biogenesis protein